LIIVKDGQIEQFIPNRFAPPHKRIFFRAGSSFNEQVFILPRDNFYSFRSVGFTSVLVLRRQNFLDTMTEHFPEDY
jgi:hypothetical protein